MTDITHYSDQELSLMFLNDEFLYGELSRAVIREDFGMLEEVARELFVFTEDQLRELAETFKQEVTESNENI
jgi:hypothetical protein